MSSSATNTEGQIAIAKGAESICARRINGDIGALEIGRAISRLDALSAPCSTLPGAHLGKRRNDLGLMQGAQTARINLHVEAGSLDQHQCAGISNVAGDGADGAAMGWNGVGVEPPLTAKIDGKAPTIVVCNFRRSLNFDFFDFHSGVVDFFKRNLAQRCLHRAASYHFPIFRKIDRNKWLSFGAADVVDSAIKFGFKFSGSDNCIAPVWCCDFGCVHFISPTPDYPRRGRFALMHSMSCIVHTKQNNTRTFCNFFQGAKPAL